MNKKSTRALASATVVGLVLTTAISTGNVQAAPGKVDRLHGANRYETAAKVATSNWKAGETKNVILVSGEGYADALSASLLAQKLNAPVLLTGKDSLDVNAKNAIKELGAKHVYILGSKGVVSGNIQSSLEKEGKKVTRLAGKDRYETNIAIANELVNNKGVDASEVLVVNGNKYLADALTAAPVAAKEGKILLLVGEDEGSANEAKKFIDAHGSKATVIGRDVTVSDAIYNKLGATKRVKGGSDRFETNRLVLDAFKMKGSHVYVANGQNDHLVDSLVASALAGKFKSPVVLVSNDKEEDAEAVKYMKENLKISDKTDLNVVGSEAILSDDLVKDIDNAVVPEVSKEELVKKANEAIKAIPAEINKDNLENARAAVAKAETAVKAVKDAKVDVKELKGLDKIEAANKKIAGIDKAIAEAKKALKVESVSAINGKQVKIIFNKAVNKDDVISGVGLTPNITIEPLVAGIDHAIGTPVAKLSENGKEVVITAEANNFFKGNYRVTVKNAITEKDDTSKAIAPYSGILNVKDEVKAVVKEVESKTNDKKATSAKVTFSEPVSAVTIKIDGTVVNGVLAADGLSWSATGLDLDAEKEHKLEVIGLTDFAGNILDYATQTFKVTKDAAAPTVAVSTKSDNKIVLTFNKDMKDATVVANNIKIFGKDLAAVAPSDISPAEANDHKNFIITLPSNIYDNENSVKFKVAFKDDAIEDSLGNKLAVQSVDVQLSKNTVAPVITEVTYQKDTNGVVTGLVVKTDKELAAVPAGIVTNGIKVINKDGVDVTTNFLANNSSSVKLGDKQVVFKLHGTNNAIKSGEYTFMFPAELITDSSVGAKKTAAKKVLVNFGDAKAEEFKIVGDDAVSVKNNIITVKYSQEVKGGAVVGSATDLNNYTLYGTPLPEGTVITLSADKNTATIALPTGTIVKNDTAAMFGIRNVQNVRGTAITQYLKAIAVKDNTDPVLKSAKVVDNKTIVLTYDEDMDTLSDASVGEEFEIKQGKDTLTLTDAELKADSLSGYKNQIKLSIKKGADAAANPGTAEVNTLTVVNAASAKTGKIKVTFNDGTINKPIDVELEKNDTAIKVAEKIKAAMESDADIKAAYTVTNDDGKVVFTAKKAATDKNVTITTVDTDGTGVGTPESVETKKGVAPTPGSSATTLDLSKDLTIKPLKPSNNIDIKDASGNVQKILDSVITITKAN